MIIFQSVFSLISTIISIICLVWLVGLGVFVLVRSIVLKVKTKKQMKEDLKDYHRSSKCKLGSDDDDTWKD